MPDALDHRFERRRHRAAGLGGGHLQRVLEPSRVCDTVIVGFRCTISVITYAGSRWLRRGRPHSPKPAGLRPAGLSAGLLFPELGYALRAPAGPARTQARPAAPAGGPQAGQPGAIRQQLGDAAGPRNGDDRPDPAAGQRQPLPRSICRGIGRHATHDHYSPSCLKRSRTWKSRNPAAASSASRSTCRSRSGSRSSPGWTGAQQVSATRPPDVRIRWISPYAAPGCGANWIASTPSTASADPSDQYGRVPVASSAQVPRSFCCLWVLLAYRPAVRVLGRAKGRPHQAPLAGN